MDSRKLALLCRELAGNKKAEHITILDVRELSSVTDYFVIASGTSQPHLRAIVDEVQDKIREEMMQAESEKKFQEWMKSLKSKAYVENKL